MFVIVNLGRLLELISIKRALNDFRVLGLTEASMALLAECILTWQSNGSSISDIVEILAMDARVQALHGD